MSTYLDQSSTNLDLSSAETPQAPNKEIKLFNLGGGPPNNENLTDELLETRDGQPPNKEHLNETLLETRDGQRPRLKSLISRPRDFPSAGEMQQRAPPALSEAVADFLGAEIGRRRPIHG